MDYKSLLAEVAESEYITDLHLTVHSRPYIRKDGTLEALEGYEDKLSNEVLKEIFEKMTDESQKEEFEQQGEVDFSYSLPGVSRFRVNAYHQRGSVSIALRVIPSEVPSIDELNLPQVLKKLAAQRRGLVLSTGPTGSGKSTTQAAIINEINNNRSAHIITLEDPIEYLHRHNKCLVHQREVGEDTEDFPRGLRAALRQDPDVILVGEMRDKETIETALKAAETGHLVLATLHTNSAPATIDRIIDIFPPNQQDQVRIQLASVISGVLAQQLLSRKDEDGLIAAFEIMISTAAIRNIIREGKTSQLYSAIQTGGQYDMVTMDNYLLQLYRAGKIKRESVIRNCYDLEYVKERMN